MQKQENPRREQTARAKANMCYEQTNTPDRVEAQGFCATCPYFRVSRTDSGRVRRVCRFTGERLPLVGNPLCEMPGGNHE